MRYKEQLLRLVILVALLSIAGCCKADRYASFSKMDQTLSWFNERNRSFGDADYSTINEEEDAFRILREKYKVEIPSYYERTKKMLGKELTSNSVQRGTTKYAVFSRDKELEFRTIYPFYRGEELQVFSEVVLTYSYSVDQKQAYLKSQVVTVKISPVKGNLPNNNLKELLEAIGKNMKIPENQITSGIAGYEKKVKETEMPITDDYLPIVSNAGGLDKETEFLKEIAAVYDEAGTFRELYAEISDQI